MNQNLDGCMIAVEAGSLAVCKGFDAQMTRRSERVIIPNDFLDAVEMECQNVAPSCCILSMKSDNVDRKCL